MKKKIILVIVLFLVIVGLAVGAVLLFDKSDNKNDVKIPDNNQPHSEVIRGGGASPEDDFHNNGEKEENGKEQSSNKYEDNGKNIDQDKDILNEGYTYIYRDDQIREKVPLSDLTEADEKNDKGGSSKEKDTVKESKKETKK